MVSHLIRYLVIAVLARQVDCLAFQDTDKGEPNAYLTFGIMIGSIEEGARIFTPIRLLPFDHPESLGHEFPNALQFHRSEYEALVYLGEKIGLKLATTLQRYPKQPTDDWVFSEFQRVPLDSLRQAKIIQVDLAASHIPGLGAVALKDRFPLCFIVDTRGLTLKERGMSRPTAMGLDMTRARFLEGLNNIALTLPSAGSFILIFRSQPK